VREATTLVTGARDCLARQTNLFPPSSTAPSVYGFFINQVGDIDGDGYGDVVIGAQFDANFTGSASLYMGSASGLGAEPAAVLVGPDGPGGDFG
jgi:hypothetical protein